MADKGDPHPQIIEIDHVVDEALLGTTEHGPHQETEEVEVEVPGVTFNNSEDDVNDDDFVYDNNVEERIAVGLNLDSVVEKKHADAIGEDSDFDHSYNPTAEELNTDYSSDEDNNDLRINIVHQTAWRARRFARILIESSDEHQFGLLWSYAAELLRTNPGSTCRIAVHEDKFQGIYVCLDVCKKGFLSGCRQLVRLDGCFLKGSFGGQMLVAVTLDANDCIYPLAFAIVEREQTSSWRWFMRNLGGDLRIVNCNEWTFMSDRQKGLLNVIEEMYPQAEHRLCVSHMYTNFFRSEFRGLALKEILWKATKSTTVADYMFWMSEMEKQSKPAYEWLLKRDPKEWSKSHFLTKVKSDILLNNMCECFNKVVLEDGEK
ncbi:Uncharacterized protein Adt_11830 [Abeliophyllum distichum]|uniref:MULE transposase domain-containing protein n=1 Tax=Abeliophyllum distichum TaxID=126358 RepID=A0ABD1UP88_9LAMI